MILVDVLRDVTQKKKTAMLKKILKKLYRLEYVFQRVVLTCTVA